MPKVIEPIKDLQGNTKEYKCVFCKQKKPTLQQTREHLAEKHNLPMPETG